MTSAGNVEGEQREGERTADEFSPSDGAPQPQAEAEGPDDGDELAEPVWIDARTRANRENATRSTGPTTEEGKRRSSRNALKHGGYGEKSLAIPSGPLAEDQEAIDEYLLDLVDALDPRTAFERTLAANVANLMLRSERIVRYEAGRIGAPSDMIVFPSDDADRAYAQACREALRCIDEVTKIDARNGAALQRALRQYQQVREMGLAI